MKVALYVRVSTAEQDTGMQLDTLREYCRNRHWSIYREYVDQGISGTTAARPELEAMMRDSTQRKFDAVLVWKFDRLFRSVPHMMAALERFRSLGVDFISITEAIDTTAPIGKMVYTLLAAIAEFEHDLMRERTLAGIATARANGKRIGRPRAEIDVKEALRLRGEPHNLSYRAIAERMGVSSTVVFQAICRRVLEGSGRVSEQKHVEGVQ